MIVVMIVGGGGGGGDDGMGFSREWPGFVWDREDTLEVLKTNTGYRL